MPTTQYLNKLKEPGVHLKHYYDNATDATKLAGSLWYPNTRSVMIKLSQQYKVTLPIVCGITARLSPSISWERNILATESVLRGESTVDGYAYNVDMARKIAAGQFGDTDCSVSFAFSRKALKTFAFYQNILKPQCSLRVTIDRWMIRASMPTSAAMQLESQIKISKHLYEHLEYTIQALAKKERVVACAYQATVWLAMRENWHSQAVLSRKSSNSSSQLSLA